MKKSRKILLYGLLSSILLIILCLYLHQSEFINAIEEPSSEPIDEKVLVEEPIKENNVEEKKVETKRDEKKLVLIERIEPEVPKEEVVNTPVVVEENISTVPTVIVPNVTPAVNPTTESIVVKAKSVETNITKKVTAKVVDENLPSLDNFPILDKATIDSTQGLISNIIKSDRIHFYKNRSKLTNKGRKTLDKVVDVLKDVSDINITVKGYTDASGRRKMNRWVSSQRAKSVKDYLVSKGISIESIEVKGFGEDKLLYPNKPYSTLNRRVEIEIKRK